MTRVNVWQSLHRVLAGVYVIAGLWKSIFIYEIWFQNLFRLAQVMVKATRNASNEVVNPRFHTMKARQKLFAVSPVYSV